VQVEGGAAVQAMDVVAAMKEGGGGGCGGDGGDDGGGSGGRGGVGGWRGRLMVGWLVSREGGKKHAPCTSPYEPPLVFQIALLVAACSPVVSVAPIRATIAVSHAIDRTPRCTIKADACKTDHCAKAATAPAAACWPAKMLSPNEMSTDGVVHAVTGSCDGRLASLSYIRRARCSSRRNHTYSPSWSAPQ
jgi:hypothetical protein